MNTRIFSPYADFLTRTLATDETGVGQLELADRTVRYYASGVLEFIPHGEVNSALLLSAGIHGNETAPIEIINNLVTELLSGNIQLKCALLVILGHPQAMRLQQRYIETNLNRLFVDFDRRVTFPPSIELKRATLLCDLVDDFFFRHDCREQLHLDLHTAIRGSKRQRFAIFPYVENRHYRSKDIQLLLDCGVESVLLMHKAGNTFSSYCGLKHGVQSYTVELGKVHPFGRNDLFAYQDVQHSLTRLLSGSGNVRTEDSRQMEFFSVKAEVIHTGPGFELMLTPDQQNFSEYRAGDLVWRDKHQEYRVAEQPELMVFPNPQVEVGHRAALLLTRLANSPH